MQLSVVLAPQNATAAQEGRCCALQDVIAAFGLRSEDAGSLSSSRSSTGISLTVVLTIIGVAIVAGGVLTYVGYSISSMRERRKRRLRRNTVHTSTMSAAEPQVTLLPFRYVISNL